MKLLNGTELAGFIKERHARQVRELKGEDIQPKLAIVQVKDDPAINTYVRLKREYGGDIGVEVEVHKPPMEEVPKLLNMLSNSNDIHGIIVQLPLPDSERTDEIVNLVAPSKDVDALGKNSDFEPATPTAILWLLNGYNIDLAGKHVLLIGRGKLVGQPLEKILKDSGVDVEVADSKTPDLRNLSLRADVIITATGSPGILGAEMIKQAAVVVDAGTSGEDGKMVGDLAPDVYQRDDLTVTPQKGGVGPLTVCALFENVIRAAQKAA